jgi:NADH:ubiquinone oxidoreductase subunit F (NADH-binding)
VLTEFTAATLDRYLDGGGGRGIESALAITPEAVIDRIVESGLRGRGGAGFPTGLKWRSVRSEGAGVRFVVCNGAEGEPGAFKDRWLLRRNPYLALEGIAIATYAVGASAAFIGLKSTFTVELERVRAAVREMEEGELIPEGLIFVVAGPDQYLLGEETGLLQAIEGDLPLPRVEKPFVRGLFAHSSTTYNPTVVNNVETLSNVPLILADGPLRFRAFGTERSPGTMLFSVAGDVVTAGVFELPLGTPLRVLIEDVAGGCPEGRALKALFPGASNTVILPHLLDVPLDFESVRSIGSGLGAGCFIVFDETACMVKAAQVFSRFLWVESCGQCPACKLGCEAITRSLGRLERGVATSRDLTAIQARSLKVADGSRCALPLGEARVIQSVLRAFRDEFSEHLEHGCALPRQLRLPKIIDFDERLGRFTYDERYAMKQPDWMYAGDRRDATAGA